MALDLSKLSGAAYGANALSGLILVKPEITGIQAQNGTEGLEKSLIFHYEGEQSIALESDITDHFVENNTHINDHIALKPETITTQGFIGELNDYIPPEFNTVKEIKEKLVSLSAYAPELSVTAARAYNLAFQGYQAVKKTKDNIEAFRSGINQTEQQKYYSMFYGYWKNRTLFNVQTPWAQFKNMAIQSLRSTQEQDSQSISTFEITFKQMRFSDEAIEVETRQISESFQQERSYNQGLEGSAVNGGANTFAEAPASFNSSFLA